MDPAVRTVLLDIEGTTTPVSFVYDVLFPYAREHVRDVAQDHLDDHTLRDELAWLRREHGEDTRRGEDPPPWPDDEPVAGVVRYVRWLMDRDRKSTGLKALQGRIWSHGYRTGELRGEVYPDVPPALARWRGEGRDVAIFSSGSVLAQRLLFAHSTAGDLTPWIAAYFDTTTGPKKEPESYARIATARGRRPPAILFVSDVAAELDAARTAGMQTALCARSAPPETSDHPVVRTFDEL